MSKGLRNMEKVEQVKAIDRRLADDTKGLGYWAAFDAKIKILGRMISEPFKESKGT